MIYVCLTVVKSGSRNSSLVQKAVTYYRRPQLRHVCKYTGMFSIVSGGDLSEKVGHKGPLKQYLLCENVKTSGDIYKKCGVYPLSPWITPYVLP